MTDFQTALVLLAVGFPAVFFILFLVIALGKGLILFVNRYFPENKPVEEEKQLTGKVSGARISVIVGAVQAVTEGKGKVVAIEKIVD